MQLIYEAWSINPFLHEEVRNYQHKNKECPLLSKWIKEGGGVGELQRSIKPKCPYCWEKVDER